LAAATVAWSINVYITLSDQKGQTVEESWTYSFWGAAAGAAAVAIVGFTWGGWANASANLVALKNISQSWSRRDYIVSGGWATFGQSRPFELAEACAEALNKL
jgi:hypothetical protein